MKIPPRQRRRLLLLALGLAVGGVGMLTWRARPEGDGESKRDGGVASPSKSIPVASSGAATPSSPISSAQARPAASAQLDALFAYATPANAAALDAALPGPTREIHYVRLNAELIGGPRSPFWRKTGVGVVAVPLPDGGALRVVIDQSEMLGPDRFTSTGHVEGRSDSRAVFAWNEGFLHASIEDADLGSFALRTATEEYSQFYRVDPALVGACGGPRVPVIDANVVAAAAARRARGADATSGSSTPSTPVVAGAENYPSAEVHVMMVYTQAVLPTLTGTARTSALQSAFDATIAAVNSSFAASLVSARVKLVRIAETTYDESAAAAGSVQDVALTALYNMTDGKMDEIHALRDQVGADLVCLALNRADFASTGLAFVLATPGENTNPLFGFSVVQYGVVAATRVVSHELGHCLGCAHDREHASGPGAFSYSYGYRFTASNGRQYHDIMSYDPGTGLSYFSNPAISAPSPAPANSPGGVAPGLPGESATALTIDQLAFEVTTYRLQTQTAANNGTLLNVSTRAFVGNADQNLIGGFVVSGTTDKKMLLRAAGPSLAAYGVTDAIADPAIDLYAGTSLVVTNDNWSTPANGVSAAQVEAAAGQAGAFPFVVGSADAALLVTLKPGAYTAVVRGARGTTGTALVEAYEVGAAPGANRIVNLSSRAYADNLDRKLIGGFVVSATPVTSSGPATKRVLIRVLGPTLARYGVPGPMNDPYLQLRNGAGELMIANDDWSTGTTAGSASPTNDFKPRVRYYNEQQIFATGFAPSNRREPCVLVDLLPGRYTVTVQPFELRDPDPALDEPAEPGVALVEVYEISPP